MQAQDPVSKRLDEIDEEWRDFIKQIEFEPLAKFLEAKLFEPKPVEESSSGAKQ